MKYALLGLMYDQQQEEQLIKKVGPYIQPQVNQYQWGIVNGVNANTGKKVDIFASIPVGSFPKSCKKLFIKKHLISSSYGINYIPVTALAGIRERQRERRFYKALKTYLLNAEEKVALLVYSFYYPFMKVIKKLKKRFKDKVEIVLIVPDLPGKYGVERANPIRRFFDRRKSKHQYQNAYYVDKFVLLAEAMKDPIGVGDRDYVVIEGFLPKVEEEEINKTPTDKKVILYSGIIGKEFGIGDLLQQFSMIKDDNLELHLYGNNSLEAQKVMKHSKTVDNRVKYLGFVSKNKILAEQKKATLLVNPRSSFKSYTKYSFPSKTMEYMLSGTPTVMFDLEGVPNEYKEYLLICDSNSKTPLYDKFVQAFSMEKEQLEDLGKRAKKFVLENKNSKKQTEKLIKMIEG